MTTRWPFKVFVPALLVVGIAVLGAGGNAPSSSTPPSQAKTAAAPPPATTSSTATTGHEGHTMSSAPAGGSVKGENMTITGEVMDPACFLEAGAKSIGPGHFQCAIDCARSGQTLAIYDRDHDLIYFIAGELPGKNPNEPLMAYIHKKVDVTGMVYHRSGAYGIVIRKVVPHVEKTGGTPPTGAAAPTK